MRPFGRPLDARGGPAWVAGLFLSLSLGVGASAQSIPGPGDPVGTSAGQKAGAIAGSYALSGFETVNLFNGNLVVDLGLRDVVGRGEARAHVGLSIQRRFVVQQVPDQNNILFDYLRLDWLKALPLGEPLKVRVGITNTYVNVTRYDGAETNFEALAPFGAGCYYRPVEGGPTSYVSDSGGCNGLAGAPNGFLLEADGTRHRIVGGLLQHVQDRNGNTITFGRPNASTLVITDSLERTTTIVHGSGQDTVTFAGRGGATRTLTVIRTSLSSALASGAGPIKTFVTLFPAGLGLNWRPSSAYAGVTDPDLNPYLSFNPQVVSRVELPDGRNYVFRYNEYGELVKVTLPTGGRIEYSWGAGKPTNPRTYRRVNERTVFDDSGIAQTHTLYTRVDTAGSAHLEVTHRDPKNGDASLGSDWHFFIGDAGIPSNCEGVCLGDSLEGRETKTEWHATGGALLKRVENDWQSGTPGPRIVATTTTLGSKISKETYDYNQFLNRTGISTYDFGTGSAGGLLRRIVRTFLTAAAYTDVATHVRNIMTTEQVIGSANELISETSFGIDEFGLVPRSNPTGHDSSFGPEMTRRGNVTSATRTLLGGAANPRSTMRYDVLGNVVSSTDGNGNQSTFDFDDNFGDSDGSVEEGASYSTFAFATTIKNPSGHVSRRQYDYFLGAVVDSQDPNGVLSSSRYEDVLDRVTEVTAAVNRPSAARTTFSYNDVQHYVDTRADKDDLGDGVLHTRTLFDALGRKIEDRHFESATNYIATTTDYDGKGRVHSVSNPYRPGDAVVWTTTSYDALDRPVSVTAPGGAAVTTAYVDNRTTVTDPAGKARQSVADGLGRVVEVIEDPSGTNLSTKYTYNAADRLLIVKQGAQQRDFGYDSLGRLQSATNPESGQTTYDYDANDNLTKRRDARGVVTHYAYDGLNRILTRSYDIVSGVAPTEAVSYSYDASQGAALGRLTSATTPSTQITYSEYDAFGRPTAHHQRTNGRLYSTAYEYNLAGMLTLETYPTGREIAINYDQAGRISGISGGKPGGAAVPFVQPDTVGYAAHGGAESLQLANGKWEETRFNTRLQPTLMGLGNTNSASTLALLRLEYDYGSASQNNGNVAGQSIIVGGNTFSQSYSYDALNRLSGAAETKNGSANWSQSYGLDRFGNRWVSSSSFALSASTPTAAGHLNASNNRLSLGSAQYDPAGNLVVDPVSENSTFDAENRQTRFQAGATPTEYAYDGDGRRVRKHQVGGHTSVYVYDAAGRLVTEHSDEDTQRPAKDFIYAGAKLLAEVKGSIPALAGPVLLGPTGTIYNCAPDATFNFRWKPVPSATEYILHIDGEVAGDYDAGPICTTEECSVEPEASPTVQPFAPGSHSWSLDALDDFDNVVSSATFYYVIGPGPATPLSPSGPQSSPPTHFTWKASPGTTQYNLEIDSQPYDTINESCVGDVCSADVPAAASLGNGEHVWKMNTEHPECGLSSLPLHFTIGGVCVPHTLTVTAFPPTVEVKSIITFRANMSLIQAASVPSWTIDGTPITTGESMQYTFDAKGTHMVGYTAVEANCGDQAAASLQVNVVDNTCQGIADAMGGNWLAECSAPPIADQDLCPTQGGWISLGPAIDCRDYREQVCCGLKITAPPQSCAVAGGWCGYNCGDQQPISNTYCPAPANNMVCCPGTPPPPGPSCQEVAASSGNYSDVECAPPPIADADPCLNGWQPLGQTWDCRQPNMCCALPGTPPPPPDNTCWDTCSTRVCNHRERYVPEYCETCVPRTGDTTVYCDVPVVNCETCSDCTTTCEVEGGCTQDCSHYSCNCETVIESRPCENHDVHIEVHCVVDHCGGYIEPYDYDCRDVESPCNPHACNAANSPGVVVSDTVLVKDHTVAGNLNFLIALSAPASAPVAVHYSTVDGIAKAGTDYQAKSGTVVIAAGTSSTTVTVPVYSSPTLHADKDFTLTLTGASGAVIRRPDAGGVIRVSDAPPAAPGPTAPNGTVLTPAPAFTWSTVSGATRYFVSVRSASGEAMTSPEFVSYQASSICSNGTCSAAPVTLVQGDYQWLVHAANASANGRSSATTTFTVIPPPAPTVIGPTGNANTSAASPLLSWNAVSPATQYSIAVEVVDGAAVGSYTYNASQVCSGSTCSVAPVSLTAGSYFWRIGSTNAAGSSWGGYNFFNVVPPPAPTVISPTGYANTSAASPSLSWNAVNGATQYSIAVEVVDGPAVGSYTYSASQVCSGSTCSVAPVTLTAGSYFWRIAASNSVGSSWGGYNFFNVVPPPAPTVIGPTGYANTSAASPSLSWNAVNGATQYSIAVEVVNGPAVGNYTYNASQVCSGSTCSVAPATLTAGSYFWRIGASNSVGSTWGGYNFFNVVPPPAPSVIGPTNYASTSASPVSLSWNAVTGATQYSIAVEVVDGPAVGSYTYNASQVCSGSTCSAAPVALSAGSYFWRIGASNSVGSTWGGYNFFYVVPPPAPGVNTPLGNTSAPAPSFNWNKVNGATQYYISLEVVDGPSVGFYSYNASSVCSGSTCSVAPVTLAAGNYFWRIASGNAVGSSWGGYNFFTVVPPPPPTQVSPNGYFGGGPWPALTWNAVAGVTYYVVMLRHDDYSSVTDPEFLYYSAASVCSNGVCSVAPAYLNPGNYFWRVQSINGAGSGPWSGEMWFWR